MNIKAKKTNADGLVRVETSGHIKEVLINDDFLNPGKTSIQICFRGKSSSGIVEMTSRELESLYKNISPKLRMLGATKIMRFDRDKN